MSGLPLFWTVVFAVAVLLFLGIELVVAVGGAANLSDMVKSLLRQRDEAQQTD